MKPLFGVSSVIILSGTISFPLKSFHRFDEPTLTSPLPLFSNSLLKSIAPTFCAPIVVPMEYDLLAILLSVVALLSYDLVGSSLRPVSPSELSSARNFRGSNIMRVCRSDRCVLIKPFQVVGETNAIEEGARRGVVVDEINGIMVKHMIFWSLLNDVDGGHRAKSGRWKIFFEGQARLKVSFHDKHAKLTGNKVVVSIWDREIWKRAALLW